MYLSIGNDFAVRDKSILGIFDLDNTSYSKRTQAFLEKAEQNGQVVPCDDLPNTVFPERTGIEDSFRMCRSANQCHCSP